MDNAARIKPDCPSRQSAKRPTLKDSLQATDSRVREQVPSGAGMLLNNDVTEANDQQVADQLTEL